MRGRRITDTLKHIFIILVVILVIGVIGVQVWRWSRPHYDDMFLEAFHSLDAKLSYDGYVVTSRQDHLYLVNTRSSEINEVFIRSNWIDTLTTDNIIVYTSNNMKTGICHFNPKDASIYNNHILIEGDVQRIDPSIIKKDDKYFLTLTRVDGTINRDSPYIDNGLYSIELYMSEDLENWTYITTAYSAQQNLEDVELNADEDVLKIVFEAEKYDKGPSQIQLIQSFDDGQTWSSPITLLDNGADNEPASLLHADNEYLLFYSSDVDNPGQSYSGAEAYLARFNENYELTHISQINTRNQSSILLYQVIIENDMATLLYSNDYIGNDNLCLENISFNQLTLN